ncbi:Citrate synthase, partial [Formivibrio citricus]
MDKFNTATLSYLGKSIELPILRGTMGPKAIDIHSLYKHAGLITYDPGLISTATCASEISYIDGDKGELFYHGYPIEQLATHCDYLETCYLIKNGELPTATQYDEYVTTVKRHTMVHEQLMRLYQGFRRDAHPMAILVGVVGALSAYYQDSLDITNPEHRLLAATRLVAKMPTIVAMAYKYTVGQPFMYPRNELNYAENFLHMM